MQHDEPSPTSARPADWERVQSLFFRCLDLPERERAAFLLRECGGDAAMRAELETLLLASGEASILDHPPLHHTGDGPPEAPPGQLVPGTRLGVWRIVRYLGAGGMGEVYLAERAEGGFNQRAAIKRLRTDIRGHDARFLAEREILAQLDHPRIARLLDGGVTNGHAWMAMEYVDGEQLIAHCRTHRLPLEQRLSLFRQVCLAVAHAHAHLVIHRDLKPSNILVTRDGFVKLLDFGVAKLIDAQDAHPSTATAPFTPDHAAPEQLQGAPPTIAVDIFALGVLLYELLCERAPWSQGETPLSRAIDKLLREDPRAPSQVAAGLAAPPVPARLVRGDLDAIALRCLRRAPGDRYATVDALVADLDRHGRSEPVHARRGNMLYRARRLAWRHRLALGATAAVFAALVGGLGVALWQADAARVQAARSDRIKTLVLSIFNGQDPLSLANSSPQPQTPREFVARAIEELDRTLADEPDLHAEMLGEMAQIQANLANMAGARETLDRVLSIQASLHGQDSLQIAGTLSRLCYVDLWLGRSNDAIAQCERALTIFRSHGQGESLAAARTGLTLSLRLINRQQRSRALHLAEDAVHAFEKELGPDSGEAAHALFRQAQLLVEANLPSEAEAKVLEAIRRISALHGDDSPQLIAPLFVLGDALRDQVRYDEAEAMYRRSMQLSQLHLPARHSRRVVPLVELANVLTLRRRLDEATALIQAAGDAMPEGEPSVRALTLLYRGNLFLAQDMADLAEHDLRQAFELYRSSRGEEDRVTWTVASRWAMAMAHQGRLEEAEAMQRRALAEVERILGPEDPQSAVLWDALAGTLISKGDIEAARHARERALMLTRSAYPDHHPLARQRTRALAELATP